MMPRSELVAFPVSVEVPVAVLAKISLFEADLVTVAPVAATMLPRKVMSAEGRANVPLDPAPKVRFW